MFLHNDRELFREVILFANGKTGVPESIIEKDYYETMILKLLVQRAPEIVFKGGASLSKCFHLLDRFSEDIDVTFAEHIGRSRRKKLKYDVVKPIGEELQTPIENWENVESDRDYNYYLFNYKSTVVSPFEGGVSSVRLETALGSRSFPTEKTEVRSIVYDALKDVAPELVVKYDLTPFFMNVQSISRTFIDKIFALCDYYLEGKVKRFSRHIYDVCKLNSFVVIDDALKDLATKVREHRSSLSVCPSARENVDVKSVVNDFLKSDFYKKDYEEFVKTSPSETIPYEQAVETLRKIVEKMF